MNGVTQKRVTCLAMLITAGFVLMRPDCLSAETLPAKGGLDSRIRTVTYSDEQVYRLRGFVGYAIELVFEDGETFEGNAGGDLEGITLGSHTNHVVLKPKVPNVGTNLVIYTDRRAYRFEYSAAARKPNPLTDEVMYAVRFVYPPKHGADEITEAELAEQALARATSTRPRNYDYWYCGASAIKPISAFDDGVHTRLSFSTRAELPAIFVRNEDGSESLLNFSVESGDVVIHRIASKFILRRGKVTGCVVNKGLAGSGDRLDSGTISPDVKRERRGVRK